LAPGQLQSHYSPGKPLLIGDVPKLIAQHEGERIGVLSFAKLKLPHSVEKEIVLSGGASLEEAAQKLFSALRELDKSDVDVIIAEFVPDTGLGRAINDRLRRASANR
jgi:L-threonylcarbamoyladenylate synthase